VIRGNNAPAIILRPNKRWQRSFYGEIQRVFPENAVRYFVSYYDYYQPESLVARF